MEIMLGTMLITKRDSGINKYIIFDIKLLLV